MSLNPLYCDIALAKYGYKIHYMCVAPFYFATEMRIIKNFMCATLAS